MTSGNQHPDAHLAIRPAYRSPATGTVTVSSPRLPWPKHKELLWRLYIDESQTLTQVMEYMAKQYQFVASVKQYKRQFRLWGFRKNIRLPKSDTGSPSESTADIPKEQGIEPGGAVVLSNGLKVDARRLMTYLRRKSEYDKARLTTGSPFGIKPPDTYYSNETALFHLREYDDIIWQPDSVTVDQATQNLYRTHGALLRWTKFSHAILQAAKHVEDGFEMAAMLMHKAPEELRCLVQARPPNVMAHLIRYLAGLTALRHPVNETNVKQIQALAKALLRYITSTVATNDPLYPALQNLCQIPNEQLHLLLRTAWESRRCLTSRRTVSALDITVVADWLMNQNELSGKDIPDLETVMNQARGLVERNMGMNQITVVGDVWKDSQFMQNDPHMYLQAPSSASEIQAWATDQGLEFPLHQTVDWPKDKVQQRVWELFEQSP